MFKAGRTLGQLAEQLPDAKEQLQQLATDARGAFSRLEVSATAVTATLVVTALIAVTALIVATTAVVAARRQPN